MSAYKLLIKLAELQILKLLQTVSAGNFDFHKR